MTKLFLLLMLWQPPGTQTRGLQQSQDGIDAVQDKRLFYVERQADATDLRVSGLSAAIDDLTAAMNKFTGIGIGIGSVLTLLQIGQLIQGRQRNVSPPSHRREDR